MGEAETTSKDLGVAKSLPFGLGMVSTTPYSRSGGGQTTPMPYGHLQGP